MASDTGTIDEMFEDDDKGNENFVNDAMEIAKVRGACILEFFACPSPTCKFQGCLSHAFVEVLECPCCGTRSASIVPRMECKGEVTKLMLDRAIMMVKKAYPEMSEDVVAYHKTLPGPTKAVCVAYACGIVRQALDQVKEIARGMTGAHVAAEIDQ